MHRQGEAAAKLHAALGQWLSDDDSQGLVVTDAQLRVVVWNGWMAFHSGVAAEQALDRPLFEVCPDVEGRGLLEYYEAALGGRMTVASHALHRYLLPLPPTHKDLGLAFMPQSGRIGPLFAGGEIVGTITSLDDVSDRVAAERELRSQIEAQRAATASVEAALRAKDEFLSTLSHEVRTPLNAVLGWTRILLARQEVDAELLARALTVIERNASAQARLIDDLLDMARIVAGKLRIEPQAVDVVRIVLAAIDIVAPDAESKGVELATSFESGTPHVIGDPDRLQQIVWNLLSNALKFTPEGGRISVSVTSAGARVRIAVRDTGQGIGPEFLPHVFERFRQSDASSTRRSGGLGLGLGLVRELVELHGGTVRAESAGEGQGSTFTVELPQDVERDRASGPSVHAAAVSLDGVRVLLVEDDTDARDMTCAALEQFGAMVQAVASSAAALAVLRDAAPDRRPHVLVSDIAMPEEDGYQLIRRVRARDVAAGGRIPAVALSGYAAPEDVERALAAGYQAHLAKPMDPSALATTVRALAVGGRPTISRQ